MSLPEVEAIRRAVEGIAPRYDLRLAVLFGSAAAGTTHERSDLDIAMLAANPLDTDRIYETLAQELAFDRIDVVDLFTAPPLLAFQALRSGVVLFEDRPGRRLACLSLAARMSADSAWMDRFKDLYIESVLEKVRE